MLSKPQAKSPVNLNFLRPKARALVVELLRAAPDPVTFEELSRLVWGTALDEYQTQVIYVTTSHARRALPERRWIVGGEPVGALRWVGPIAEERGA